MSDTFDSKKIECLICYNEYYCVFKIQPCNHLICYYCYFKIDICPFCRQKLQGFHLYHECQNIFDVQKCLLKYRKINKKSHPDRCLIAITMILFKKMLSSYEKHFSLNHYPCDLEKNY